MNRSGICIFVALAFFFVAPSGSADENMPSDPLTLQEAIDWTSRNHPLIKGAELNVSRAEANHEFNKSAHAPSVEALILPRRVDRVAPDAPDSLDDSRATLRVVQPIYDFGRNSAAAKVSSSAIEQAQLQHQFQIYRQHLETMKRYFGVLLADIDYGVKDEKMTLAFLRYNRMVEENATYDTHAEVDVLAKQTIYSDLYVVRQDAQFNRAASRRSLALAMGMGDQPEYVPRDLIDPEISFVVEQEVLDIDQFLEHILSKQRGTCRGTV